MGSLELSSRVALSPLLGLALLAYAACKQQAPGEESGHAPSALPSAATAEPAPSAAAALPASASASASAQPFAHFSGDSLFEGMCPNYVRGARTRIADTKDGVLVTITVEAEAAVAVVRSRSRYLAEGKSQGGDGTGRCPVPRDAKIEVVEIEHGVELRVRPGASGTVKDLRKRARDMAAKIPAS
jgi:hypothetical protein